MSEDFVIERLDKIVSTMLFYSYLFRFIDYFISMLI